MVPARLGLERGDTLLHCLGERIILLPRRSRGDVPRQRRTDRGAKGSNEDDEVNILVGAVGGNDAADRHGERLQPNLLPSGRPLVEFHVVEVGDIGCTGGRPQ